MPGMSQPARKRRGPITLFCHSRRFRWAVISLAFGAPALYVASFGPACWIAARHKPLCRILREAYLPLGRVAHHWAPAFDGLLWCGSIGMPEGAYVAWEVERSAVYSSSVKIPNTP